MLNEELIDELVLFRVSLKLLMVGEVLNELAALVFRALHYLKSNVFDNQVSCSH